MQPAVANGDASSSPILELMWFLGLRQRCLMPFQALCVRVPALPCLRPRLLPTWQQEPQLPSVHFAAVKVREAIFSTPQITANSHQRFFTEIFGSLAQNDEATETQTCDVR